LKIRSHDLERSSISSLVNPVPRLVWELSALGLSLSISQCTGDKYQNGFQRVIHCLSRISIAIHDPTKPKLNLIVESFFTTALYSNNLLAIGEENYIS
jgi:hypothetical protein